MFRHRKENPKPCQEKTGAAAGQFRHFRLTTRRACRKRNRNRAGGFLQLITTQVDRLKRGTPSMTKAKDVDEYIAAQKEAIGQNPECGNSHYNLAVALLGKRQFEEAEHELNEALECSPGLAEAYVLLGGICMQRGDLDGCLRNNRTAIKVRPGFSEGYGNIGFVELQRGNIDAAIENFERATYFNFRYIQAFANLANAYLMKGRIDEAIETNHKALVLAPDFAPAHNNLAIAYLEKEQYALAVAHCDKAVELGYEVAPQIRQEIEAQRANLKK